MASRSRKDPFDITFASAQGARPRQEDRILCARIAPLQTASVAGRLLAIFDGHGGSKAADRAAGAVEAAFRSAGAAHPGDPSCALRETFRSLVNLTQDLECGTTATLLYLPEDAASAHLAVLGDSPAAFTNEMGQWVLGPDHNIRSNPDEKAAAWARGADFENGYLYDPENPGFELQMARSLGDRSLNRVLNREPEILSVRLGAGGFGLVASDGILNPREGPPAPQLERLMALVRDGADAPALAEDARRRQTGDNVSVIVWRAVKE